MSTANSKVTGIRQHVAQSYAELNALLDGPVGVLYAEKLYQTPTENEWTVMENLAHIAEFMPYWADEVAGLVARPGQPFGRTTAHEGRMAALREHGHDSLAQIRAALPASYAHLDAVLSKLNDSDLNLTGHHSRHGEKTLEWFIEEFITKHLSDHVGQIRECLEAIR
jgi:uncharacterized damage-inducible protein DinB